MTVFVCQHPKKIEIDRKTGIPKNVLGNTGKLTAAALAKFDLENDKQSKAPQSVAESRISTLSTLSIRPKGERPEERRERKKLLKDYRKVEKLHLDYTRMIRLIKCRVLINLYDFRKGG